MSRGGNAYFQQLLILSRLTGYYFRVINSYCIQYGCFLVTSLFVLAPCVRYGYNSLKSCWLCDEKLMLSGCAARDTHFSACLVELLPAITCQVGF